MTKKFCRNCKHLETDGMFGIFCGVVGGNNINHDCPKYEEEPEERFVPIFDGINKRVVGARDNGKIISLMDMFALLNELHEKNEELKHEYNYLQDRLDDCVDIFNENQQLKEELKKFKEWEKHIRDVRREDLDRVFKMSIYEIAEAFEYYEERIKKIEMVLEELDEYRPYSIKRAKKPYLTTRRDLND